MDRSGTEMNIIQELIDCVDSGVFGPHLERLRAELSDDDIARAASWMVHILSLYCVPEVGRKIFPNLKQEERLIRFLNAAKPLAQWFEVSECPDIFRPAVSAAERDRVVEYVNSHWHPIIET